MAYYIKLLEKVSNLYFRSKLGIKYEMMLPEKIKFCKSNFQKNIVYFF